MNVVRSHNRRSPFICSACRSRKVRCDGKSPTCTHCERLGLPCSFRGASIPHHSLERRRVKQACQTCRLRKARCSGDLPECNRCIGKNLQCIYPEPSRTFASQRSLSPVIEAEIDHFTGLDESQVPGYDNAPVSESTTQNNINLGLETGSWPDQL